MIEGIILLIFSICTFVYMGCYAIFRYLEAKENEHY